MAVAAADAGSMDTAEMEWRHVIAVAHEIGEGQSNGNHTAYFSIVGGLCIICFCVSLTVQGGLSKVRAVLNVRQYIN